MAQISKYEIRILPDKEFFKVAKSDPRYGEVDETNLGFADPQKGKAYVRQTYWPDLNKGLLLHEFEHLVENDCPKGRAHQDQYGIKHKKFFKQIAAPILFPFASPFIQKGFSKDALRDLGRTGLSTITGGLTGGPLGSILGATSQGLRNAATTDKNAFTGRSALGAGLTGVATGGLSRFLGGAEGFSNLLTNPTQAFKGGFQTLGRGLSSAEGKIGDVIQAFRPGAGTMGEIGVGETGTGALSSGRLGFGRPLLKSLGFENMLKAGDVSQLRGIGAFGALPQSTQGFQWSDLLNKPMGNLAVAGGLLGASGLMGRTKVPQLSDFGSATDLQNEIMATRRGQPTSPLTQQAFGRLGERLQGEFPGVDPKILQQTNDTYDRLRATYTSQFKMFRPNADITSDSDYARGVEEIERRRAQDLSGVQQQEFNRYQERQTQAIGEALGIDRDTLQSLGNLTDQEIELALAQTTLDEGRKSQIRQFLGQLSSQFAAKGLGLNQYSINPTLFGFNVGGGR